MFINYYIFIIFGLFSSGKTKFSMASCNIYKVPLEPEPAANARRAVVASIHKYAVVKIQVEGGNPHTIFFACRLSKFPHTHSIDALLCVSWHKNNAGKFQRPQFRKIVQENTLHYITLGEQCMIPSHPYPAGKLTHPSGKKTTHTLGIFYLVHVWSQFHFHYT